MDETTKPDVKPTQITNMTFVAEGLYKFVRSTEGEIFAIRKDGKGNVFGRPISLSANMAQITAEMLHHFYVQHHTVPSSGVVRDALAAATMPAYVYEPQPFYLRYANFSDGIIIDLGTDGGEVVAVTKDGWHVLPNSPVYFKRTETTFPMVMPEEQGSLETLREIVNVTDEQWPLLVGWMLAAVFDFPRPVLFLTGSQGSAKTSTAKTLISLLDPTPVPMRTRPRDEKAWSEQASGSQIIGFDNLSNIPDWLSDELCSAVTGSGTVKRALYTNNSISVSRIHCALILTSIGVGNSLRGDLIDRMIRVELSDITETGRLEESEVKQWHEEHSAKILGAYLDLLVSVLGARETVQLERRPRMADFARLLHALDSVTGWHSLDAFNAQTQQSVYEVLDSSPFLTAVVSFMEDRNEWVGTPTQLLMEINKRPEVTTNRNDIWPKTPASASELMKRGSSTLKAHNVHFERDRSKRQRFITLKKGDEVTR